MLKLINPQKSGEDKVIGTIFADEKTEVTSGITFSDGTSPDFGSIALTVSGDVAFLDSDGTWHWL